MKSIEPPTARQIIWQKIRNKSGIWLISRCGALTGRERRRTGNRPSGTVNADGIEARIGDGDVEILAEQRVPVGTPDFRVMDPLGVRNVGSKSDISQVPALRESRGKIR